MNKVPVIFFLFGLFVSCGNNNAQTVPPVQLETAVKEAASGYFEKLKKIAGESGEGSWFALSETAEELGYEKLSLDLKIKSYKKDVYPYNLESFFYLMDTNSLLVKNPLREIKKIRKKYGDSPELRKAEITALSSAGRWKKLASMIDGYTGNSWESPVLAALIRNDNVSIENKAVIERYILHSADPEKLKLLPESSSDYIDKEYSVLLNARVNYSDNRYSSALSGYREWLEIIIEKHVQCSLEKSPPVFNEMRISAVQTSREKEWADFLYKSAKDLCGSKRFGAAYQAGRLYRNLKLYTKASNAFLLAAGAVPSSLARDRAIWYRLETTVETPGISTENEISVFSWAAGIWNNPDNFNDLMEEFVHRRIYRKEWNILKTFYNDWADFWGSSSRADAAWILAFAVKERFLTGNNETILKYLETAYSSAPYEWAGLRAAGLLGKGLPEISRVSEKEKNEVLSAEEKIVKLLLDWNLYLNASRRILSSPELYSGNVIRNAAETIMYKYPRTAIRIEGLLWKRKDFEPAEKDLILRYPMPEDLGKLAVNAAMEKNLPVELLLGLIRTESAWDTAAVSSSGAIGLAQFMPSTWSEWEKRLGYPEDSDPYNPETNLSFAAAYLEWLYEREWTFGWEDVFISYNAGGGRLRTWRSRAALPGNDLFVMYVPVEEPRLYVKKVLSAAVIYGYLYQNRLPSEMFSEWGLEMLDLRGN